jgi:hypothetical protein
MILLFSSGKKRKRAPPENATKNPSILNTGQKREQEFFFAREGLGCFLFLLHRAAVSLSGTLPCADISSP